MKRIQLSNWIIDIDIDMEKTKEYYDNISVEEGCNRAYYRNYIRTCKAFSKEVLKLYKMLGIEP